MDGSSFALQFAQKTAGLLGILVERLIFRLVDVKDEAGLFSRLRVSFKDLQERHSEIVTDANFQSFLNKQKAKGRLPTYFSKSVTAFNLSNRQILWRALLLIQIVAWKGRKEAAPSRKPLVFFMERRAWIHSIRDYGKQNGVEIVLVLSKWGFSYFKRWLGYWYYALLDMILILRVRALSKERGLSKNTKIQDPKVAVDYYGHFNLDQPEYYSDFFFWHQSKLSGENLLTVFHSAADPVDQMKWDAMKKHGIASIALSSKATLVNDCPIHMHWSRFRNPKPLWLGVECSQRRLEKIWMKERLFEYQQLRCFWRELFENQKAKVYLSWYRYDETHCAIADAVKDVGGIMAIYQRAFDTNPSSDFTIDSDIAFGFSHFSENIERLSESIIPYYIITGYLGDHRIRLLKDSAKKIRNKMQQKGTRRIVSFTDENSIADSRWHTGHEFMRVNYEFLLEKVLQEPSLGLILKPKAPNTLRKRLGDVAELLKKAERTGRCYIYEAGPLQNSYPPAIAALSADIAIHGHLCAPTAALECALTGTPTLLMDREGWPASPLYQLGVGKVVFNDWETLWKACEEHWKNPKGIPGFGEWGSMLAQLDPFRDGRAAERMGTYIQWLLEGFKAGLDRETVMADAAERYCRLWGKDKVVSINGISKAMDIQSLQGQKAVWEKREQAAVL